MRTESGSAYSECTLCPRDCRVNRTSGKTGFCGETAEMRAAAALLHFGEEPPISGIGGSGTVFFTGCTLKCGFCQNYQLSSGGVGRIISCGEAADIFLKLQAAGAENINIVTGTHFLPGIEAAVRLAWEKGLHLPIVWNTSGYENAAGMEMLDGFASVYLPDVKTVSPAVSAELYRAPGYAEAVRSAVKTMVRTRPLRWKGEHNKEPLLAEGVIIRHLVLPGHLDISRDVLRWYADEIGDEALFSLMFQYTPMSPSGGAGARLTFSEEIPQRRIKRDEYETVLQYLDEFGIEEGFVQEFENDNVWYPDFTRPAPFSADDSRVIWHCHSGNEND